jgi:hypothetical protein
MRVTHQLYIFGIKMSIRVDWDNIKLFLSIMYYMGEPEGHPQPDR